MFLYKIASTSCISTCIKPLHGMVFASRYLGDPKPSREMA